MHRLLKRLIIFLVRKRLGLKKGERFQFHNQASKHDTYYFDSECVLKDHYKSNGYEVIAHSHVSLNYLLDDRCKIVKVKEEK